MDATTAHELAEQYAKIENEKATVTARGGSEMILKLRVWWILRRNHSVDGKIKAIKLVRAYTGWGLAASKAYVDEIAERR